MATLITGYNPQYSKNASVLTGNPNRVTVEVEDNIDQLFWKNVLTELCPQKDFHFKTYRTITKEDGTKQDVRGKSLIVNSAKTFKEYHIGCVDSDYDWLLSNFTDKGRIINGTKYLIHTYAYSIENLMCLSATLNDFCAEITEEVVDFDFESFMRDLSKIIYPLLVWSLYLCSKEEKAFTPTDWRQVLVSNAKTAKESLRLIQQKVNDKLKELEGKYASLTSEKESMSKILSDEKEITSENAYLFVRGHDLFDLMANVVLSSIIVPLRKQHYKSLKESRLDPIALVQSQKAYQKKDKPIKDMLKNNYRYKKRTFIYDKIMADVSLIWNIKLLSSQN